MGPFTGGEGPDVLPDIKDDGASQSNRTRLYESDFGSGMMSKYEYDVGSAMMSKYEYDDVAGAPYGIEPSASVRNWKQGQASALTVSDLFFRQQILKLPSMSDLLGRNKSKVNPQH